MGFMNWLKEVIGIDTETHEQREERLGGASQSAGASNPEAQGQADVGAAAEPILPELPMDEAEKEMVAVIAACIVGKESPDVNLHIQKIRRIQ